MILNKLESLNLLRGIAVLAVCFGHYGNALSSGHVFSEMFKLFHDYGKYGVQVFFVISGFVIPLSLYKSQYSFSSYGKFLLKRLIRLHPPYLVALALSLVIGFFAFRTRNLAFPETFQSIVLSLFYGHVSDINPVFWTLIVEAQFYIFIGIAYVWFIRFPNVFLFIAMPLLLLLELSDITKYIIFFAYISYFLIGWLGFLIYTKKNNIVSNFFGIIAVLVFTFTMDGIPSGVAALFAIGTIILYNGGVPLILRLPSKISYSLYLIHYPIGVKFINLLSRYVAPQISWILFPLALALALALAWFFWKYIENPWAERSGAMKYKVSKQ